MPNLASLIASSKVTGDLENNEAVTEPAWTLHVNRAHEDVFDRIALVDPRRFRTTFDFPLTSSVNSVALPSNFLRLVRPGVMKDPTLVNRRRVRRFNPSDVGQLASLRYDMPGQTLIIEPYNLAAGNYRMYYASTVTPMVNPADPMDTRLDQYVENIEVIAAIKARGSKQLDVAWLERRLVQLDERMELTVRRDAANPETTADEQTDAENEAFDLWPWLP